METRIIRPQIRYACLFTIKAYEKGVLLRFGKSKGELGDGLHIRFPFGIDEIRVLDTRPQEHSVSFSMLSNDRIKLEASVNIRYKVEKPEDVVVKALDYERGFDGYIDKLMEAKGCTEVCKNMSMQYAVENRDKVGDSIQDFLGEQVDGWGVGIEKVVVKELNLPPEIPRAEAYVKKADAAKKVLEAYPDSDKSLVSRNLLAPLIFPHITVGEPRNVDSDSDNRLNKIKEAIAGIRRLGSDTGQSSDFDLSDLDKEYKERFKKK